MTRTMTSKTTVGRSPACSLLLPLWTSHLLSSGEANHMSVLNTRCTTTSHSLLPRCPARPLTTSLPRSSVTPRPHTDSPGGDAEPTHDAHHTAVSLPAVDRPSPPPAKAHSPSHRRKCYEQRRSSRPIYSMTDARHVMRAECVNFNRNTRPAGDPGCVMPSIT